jgi:hypothetical protein
MMADMAKEPVTSPFSRPPAPPKTFARPVFTTSSRTITAPKPAGPVEVGENLPLGFMAGLAAAAVGASLWALITILINYQNGWMAIGVGFLVGGAVRMAGKGSQKIFGIMGAGLALGGCAVGNLLAVLIVAVRHFDLPALQVFARLTPDVVVSLMEQTFKPLDLLFYVFALVEGYRFSIVGRT